MMSFCPSERLFEGLRVFVCKRLFSYFKSIPSVSSSLPPPPLATSASSESDSHAGISSAAASSQMTAVITWRTIMQESALLHAA